jgi:hypothetical protein
MKKEDLTILIQGPLNETSLSNIDEYLKFGKVVISCWNKERPSYGNPIDPVTGDNFEGEYTRLDAPSIDNIPKNENIKVVCQDMPSREQWDSRWIPHGFVHGPLKNNTFPWAWMTTINGLKNIDTTYVIKTRSDEKFVNLQPMINLHLETDKMIWGNIWAKTWSSGPHHIGDHIFMDKTERLLKTYNTIYENKDLVLGSISAEQILSIAYIRARGLDEKSIEDAMKVYEYFDIDKFDDWLIRHGRWNKTFTKKEHPKLNLYADQYGLQGHLSGGLNNTDLFC